MLGFNQIFNILALLVAKIQNHTKIECLKEKELYHVLIHSIEISLTGNNDEEFGDFLRFLYYKDNEDIRLFDIDCLIAKERQDEAKSDFQNNKYKISLSQELSTFLQNWFYNLKEVFYEEKDKELFFNFLNKSVTEKRLPIIMNKGKYEINEKLFNEGEQVELVLFDNLFKRNKNTQRSIVDNVKEHQKLIIQKDLQKIKEFEAGRCLKVKEGNIKGGKNRFKNKKIEDIELGNKQDKLFLANYLKNNLFKDMYFKEIFPV